MTTQEIAKALTEFAKDESNEDRADIKNLVALVKVEDWKAAKKFMRGLDTFVREGIPSEVYSEINTRGAGSKKVVTASVRLKDCKKVFKKGFEPGVIATVDLEFPGDATQENIAMGIAMKGEDIVAQFVDVEYSDVKEIKL